MVASTRTETYEARVLRLALESTDPHAGNKDRTRALVLLSKTLRGMPEPGHRRVVTALRLLTNQPDLLPVLPNIVDVRGNPL